MSHSLSISLEVCDAISSQAEAVAFMIIIISHSLAELDQRKLHVSDMRRAKNEGGKCYICSASTYV